MYWMWLNSIQKKEKKKTYTKELVNTTCFKNTETQKKYLRRRK